jgi:hypothetical protein
MFRRLKAWINWYLIMPLQYKVILPTSPPETRINNKKHKKIFERGYRQALKDVKFLIASHNPIAFKKYGYLFTSNNRDKILSLEYFAHENGLAKFSGHSLASIWIDDATPSDLTK